MAEFVLRIALPQDLGIWQARRDGLVLLRPNVVRHLPGFGQTVETNSLGLRDPERAPDPAAFQILLLGDSFMEALQVPAEESLPRLLERELRGGGRHVEVINAGVSGWGTDDQLAFLERVVPELEPDLILVAMTLHNDVSDNLEREFHTLVGGTLRARTELMPIREYRLLRIKGFLAAHSHLYRLVTRTLRSAEVGERSDALRSHVGGLLSETPDPRIDAGWTLTFELLDAIRARAERAGAGMAVFLIPLRIQIADDHLQGFLEKAGLPAAGLRADQPQRRMAEWAERSGAAVIDLREAFRARKRRDPAILYLPHDGHWNASAHALAAHEVAVSLGELGLVPEGRDARTGNDTSAPQMGTANR